MMVPGSAHGRNGLSRPVRLAATAKWAKAMRITTQTRLPAISPSPGLTELIHTTMPDDTDAKCSAEDSAAVATYIYDTFYSVDARVRNKPARIELSRLTVRQHQNALAELIGGFRSPADWKPEHGLLGSYYAARTFNPKKLKLERTDSEVCFDWERLSPDPEMFDPREFSIQWEGSLLAPDTGTYEFVVRTVHAARFYINDSNTPLIDAWVQSGDDLEHRGEIRLLGGRAYPIKLQFSRAKQGVGDLDKNTAKFQSDAPTTISFEWKPEPHARSRFCWQLVRGQVARCICVADAISAR